ncbi:hypothetical protein HMPREF9413_5300 [Paenibacillus sp. HGF7]|nr:hypothetical protein HMPREF9413_5300 [Paenibacillus sp. HGF7]
MIDYVGGRFCFSISLLLGTNRIRPDFPRISSPAGLYQLLFPQ